MYDNELMIRPASAGALAADMAVAYVNLGAPPVYGLVLRIVVPSIAEANDTIIPTVHFSVDGAGAGERTYVLETITKALVDAGEHEFVYALPGTKYQYVGCALDITDADAGGDFSAGVVQVGIVPAGRYTEK